MQEVMIAGVGMTHFGKFLETGLRTLAEEATEAVLEDACIAPDDVGLVFFGSAVAGLISGHRAQSAISPAKGQLSRCVARAALGGNPIGRQSLTVPGHLCRHGN